MGLETKRFDVAEVLTDSDRIVAYLEEAFADGDPGLIASAIGDVAAGFWRLRETEGYFAEFLENPLLLAELLARRGAAPRLKEVFEGLAGREIYGMGAGVIGRRVLQDQGIDITSQRLRLLLQIDQIDARKLGGDLAQQVLAI